MPTNWLTDSEQQAWRTFITTMPDLNAAFEADLATHELTMGDYVVLVFLSEAEGNHMRMCDLAAALRLSPSGLTRRLDGMVKAGWVERASCSADRRVMYAHLTERYRLDENFFREMDEKGEWLPIPYPAQLADVHHREPYKKEFASQHIAVCRALEGELIKR